MFLKAFACAFFGVFAGLAPVGLPQVSDCTQWGCRPVPGTGPYDPTSGADLSCNADSAAAVIILNISDGSCKCVESWGSACIESGDNCQLSISLTVMRGDASLESWCIQEPGKPPVCEDWGFWMGGSQRSKAVTASAAGCGDEEVATIEMSTGICAAPDLCPPAACVTILLAKCRSCSYSCTELHTGPVIPRSGS